MGTVIGIIVVLVVVALIAKTVSGRDSSSAPASTSVREPFSGRQFQSEKPIEDVVADWVAVIRQWHPNAGEAYQVDWVEPGPPPAGYESTQWAGQPVRAPEQVWAVDVERPSGAIMLAVWDGHPGKLDGSFPKRVAWCTWPGFNTSDVNPLGGLWKQRDGSISGVGWVEAAYWPY